MYLVNYAGVELSDYCFVEKVKRTLLPPRTNFSKEIPSMNGSYYTGYKYGVRKIELEVAFIFNTPKEYVEKIRELANIFNVKSPCKLILGDEPDKYYYAVLDGEFEIETVANKGARTTLTFVCHDPIAYSVNWNSFFPDKTNVITVNNAGTMEAYPHLSVRFSSDACFFQCTNYKGQTVLLGKPKNATLPSNPLTNVILDEPCKDSSNFLGLSPSLLTDSRVAEGQLGIGFNGEGIVCTNFGTEVENKWCGGALKRSLEYDVSEFEVEVDVVFSSQGKNYTPHTYVPQQSHEHNNSHESQGSYGTYKVTTKSGLIVRSSNSINSSRKAVMPYNTKVTVYEIKNGWARHSYNGLNGWSSLDYLKKISSKNSGVFSEFSFGANSEYAEEELGIIEVYGYDKNGAVLFVNQIYDGNQYYEYVEPKIFIGTQKVIDQGKNCPSARVVTTKDDNGKQTSHLDVSGVFGDFNDCTGKFVIRRTKPSKDGDYFWDCSFIKYVDGVPKYKIETPNSYANYSYPKGDLNSIGIYIGRYGKFPSVDVMAVTNLRVTRLNPFPKVPSNLEIFHAGDKLDIDFQKGTVFKNGINFLTNLDIGSDFFTVPTGQSQMLVRSDDVAVDVTCGIQERYI